MKDMLERLCDKCTVSEIYKSYSLISQRTPSNPAEQIHFPGWKHVPPFKHVVLQFAVKETKESNLHFYSVYSMYNTLLRC